MWWTMVPGQVSALKRSSPCSPEAHTPLLNSISTTLDDILQAWGGERVAAAGDIGKQRASKNRQAGTPSCSMTSMISSANDIEINVRHFGTLQPRTT